MQHAADISPHSTTDHTRPEQKMKATRPACAYVIHAYQYPHSLNPARFSARALSAQQKDAGGSVMVEYCNRNETPTKDVMH